MPEESKNDITVVAPPPVKKSKLALNKKTDKPKQQKKLQTKTTAATPHVPDTVFPSAKGATNFSSRTVYAPFTPILPPSMNPTETIVRNGPHSLNIINLKSLEPVLPRGEKMALKVWDKEFRAGWLYDEVINAFFWKMQEDNPRLIFAPSTTMTAIMHWSSTRRLWSIESLDDKDFAFIPWNATGNHWVLFALDVAKKTLLFLDPLMNGNDQTLSRRTKDAAQRLSNIFMTKFSLHNPVLEQPTKALQKDGSSCGVCLSLWPAVSM
ncbi:uncharacterized protein [Apostichopus japonicus]|uniref:uncharacterized protein n=1 Tax=Stichopus japonicus TaxID=307972 RepID=UPI003AB2AC3F